MQEVKGLIARAKKLSPARLRLTLPAPAGTRPTVLEDKKTLGDYGLHDGASLVLKDLGPQVMTGALGRLRVCDTLGWARDLSVLQQSIFLCVKCHIRNVSEILRSPHNHCGADRVPDGLLLGVFRAAGHLPPLLLPAILDLRKVRIREVGWAKPEMECAVHHISYVK